MTVLLPRSFTPTHQTAGLPGYPAIDVFGKPGAVVMLNVTGRVRRLSGHPCSEGGAPGGPYGRSIYIASSDGDRYLTHLDRVNVKVGEAVGPSTALGTICDSAVSHKPGTSHVHYGFHRQPVPIPVPPVTLFDVLGPLSGSVAKKRTPEQVAKNLPMWIRRHGFVVIQAADG